MSELLFVPTLFQDDQGTTALVGPNKGTNGRSNIVGTRKDLQHCTYPIFVRTTSPITDANAQP